MAGDLAFGDVALKREVNLAANSSVIAVEFCVGGIGKDIEIAVTVPVGEVELASSAFSGRVRIRLDKLAEWIGEDAFSGVEDEGVVSGFFTSEQGKVAFVIEHDEVVELVAIPISNDGGCAPLGDEVVACGVPPIPGGLGGLAGPLDFDGLGGGEYGLFGAADVLIPEDLAPDGVDDDVEESVVIPIGDVWGGIAPLRFTGPLDGAVGSGLNVDGLAVCFKKGGGGPLGSGFAVEVFEKGDVSGGVSRDNIFVSVVVPIDADGGGEGPEFEIVCFLLEIFGCEELRGAVWVDNPGVFHEGDSSVFVACDKILVAVPVPIDGGGGDHLDVHVVGEPDASSIDRSLGGAGIMKISETIKEFAAEDVKIAIAIEVDDVG